MIWGEHAEWTEIIVTDQEFAVVVHEEREMLKDL